MKYATVVLAIVVSAFVIGCNDSTGTGPTEAVSASTPVLAKAVSSVVHGSAAFSEKVEGIDEKSGPYIVSGQIKYTIVESSSLKRPSLEVGTYVESVLEAANANDPSFKFAAEMSASGFEDEKGNAEVEVWYPVPDASFNVRMVLNVTKKEVSVSKILFERGKALLGK